jgi:hypothetical protein
MQHMFIRPHPELADGAMCLAEQGVRAVVYLPHGGSVTLTMDSPATARWFNPRDGVWQDAAADGDAWTTLDENDWVLLVEGIR